MVLIGPILPKLARRKDGRGRPGGRTVLCLMASSAVPHGQTCRPAIRRIKPAIGGFSGGSAPACCERSSKSSRRPSTTKAIWICRKRSSMVASRPPSGEARAWADETRQGIEDHGDRRSAGAPVVVHVESATPHEVTLVHATLADRFISQLPVRLIGDNAYESDRLDAELARHGVELIAPHRSTRTQRTQDGRPLRRYRRRWKVERLCAWLQNFRRIVVRYERFAENFSRDAPPGLLPHSVAGFMRWLLVSTRGERFDASETLNSGCRAAAADLGRSRRRLRILAR